MRNIKIKICDIRTLQCAIICAQEGASFLGIHQIDAPLTEVKLKLCKDIRQFIPDISLVLVTKEENSSKLLEMCLQIRWDYIQLHFETTPQKISTIRDLLNRNGLFPKFIAVIESVDLTKEKIKSFAAVADYLLFDSSIRGGTGKLSSQENLERIALLAGDLPYFIAGGLTSKNVGRVLEIVHPYAVDVQSGVEYLEIERKHQKDPDRIRAFANTVNKL
jgi:phosphoribosylanthranilate isomerase